MVIITCAVVMGALFVVLLLVVRRGERIMEHRAQERLRLKEQLSRAERLSSLGEMAAGISHEIRNPLGIIRSSAELLKNKMARVEPNNTFPDIIVEEATRLNNIITDFIKFARPGEPNLVSCRIEDVIEKNILFLTPQMEKRGHMINTRIPDNLPAILADGDMLYQAFLNILLNAMQAMPGGGIVQIAVEAVDEAIRIQFDDEGEGIPNEIIEKIWDPFFTTKETGTGLGLGLVKNIIESHGGVIRIENRPVQGVRIAIDLPVLVEE
jgi:signal transduction histidine kinase